MGDEKTASQSLREDGFIAVERSTERVAGDSKRIEKGAPFTWDANNGVTVVYDERGQPWVKKGNLNIRGGFRRGAYVPYSNDGGASINRLFPN